MEAEQMGPAERIVQQLVNFQDHLVHNRPGMVTGGAWTPVRLKRNDTGTQVFALGRKGTKPRLVGGLDEGRVVQGGRVLGEYRRPGIMAETALAMYQQVADVWAMDQEFVARWASWAFAQTQRDLKVVLCGFMLVQNRYGEPVVQDGEVLFFDDDYRGVGEAMCLASDSNALSPKLLVRVGDLLGLAGVADINRKLGFGKSARSAPMGRYPGLVTKWLRYREQNPTMLDGLVRAGYTETVKKLARRVGYKPDSPGFFEKLRWRQSQAKDGRRAIAIGTEWSKGDTWEGLDEGEICQRIVDERPNYKTVAGRLPGSIGLTRAVMAAVVEAGSLSDADYVILTPTLEELGLVAGPQAVDLVKTRWEGALKRCQDQRAANVARNVKSKEVRDRLVDAADEAAAGQVAEVTRDLRVYCVVDKSMSMEGALERAIEYLTRFLGGFPLERLHVSVFNTVGSEVTIRAAKRAAVEQAFRGHRASGGTSYAAGVQALLHHKPGPTEDALVLFVGDEGDRSAGYLAEIAGQLNPVAFGLLPVVSPRFGRGQVVRDAARRMDIPCFELDETMFQTDDPYATTRVLRNLIAATPVTKAVATRVTLVDQIMKTPLLQKPAWA